MEESDGAVIADSLETPGAFGASGRGSQRSSCILASSRRNISSVSTYSWKPACRSLISLISSGHPYGSPKRPSQ